MDKQVKTAAETFANRNDKYYENGESDRDQLVTAFLAGHSLANDRIKELEAALRELVALDDIDKKIVDKYQFSLVDYKDYHSRYPLAWEQARKLLNVGI